jgi:hypothetical protein
MALTFRYRFVDFGTRFSAGEGSRNAEHGGRDPHLLFHNELVTDVGSMCFSGDEPLAVIDHHFTRHDQFPSASAAVLHKAELIHKRFAGRDGVFWLVTHKQPDFDAFCSMYLARWILEDPHAILDWEEYGLAPDSWSDPGETRKIDWYDLNLHGVPIERRWPLLMASYAAIVDNSRRFPCARNRALHSILYAGLERGRDYLSETSGARDLFNEIKHAIRDKKRNPMYDSVLEDSIEFAPELAMLDREQEAYRRDVRRARKAIVYLQQCEKFSECFENVRELSLLSDGGGKLAPNPAHLLSEQPRIATDGIYLLDPECLLFKEWARLDLDNSSLGRGFEFTAVAYSAGRPDGNTNKSDYFFAIDPERSNGRHLYGVWARLQAAEVNALREEERTRSSAQESDVKPRPAFEKRAGAFGRYFADPWFDGQNYLCTIVATPNRGTTIAPPGIEPGLQDDDVVDLVRSELEHSIYQLGSATTTCIRILDCSPIQGEADDPALCQDISQLRQTGPPIGQRFRFARIKLRGDVPITPVGGRSGLSLQIGETLWQALYPDLNGATPANFAQHHLVVAPRYVGVWGDRGIAIAYKSEKNDDDGGEQDFKDVISLAQNIDELIADGDKLGKPDKEEAVAAGKAKTVLVEDLADRGEDLARDAARIKHNLTLPESELLRRFYEATGIDALLATLRDLNQNSSAHIHRQKAEEQAHRLSESTETVAEVQSKLEWLEVFIIGVYAIEMINAYAEQLKYGEGWHKWLIIYGIPLFLGFVVFVLRPWSRKGDEVPGRFPRPAWILILLGLVCLAAIVWTLLPHSG